MPLEALNLILTLGFGHISLSNHQADVKLDLGPRRKSRTNFWQIHQDTVRGRKRGPQQPVRSAVRDPMLLDGLRSGVQCVWSDDFKRWDAMCTEAALRKPPRDRGCSSRLTSRPPQMCRQALLPGFHLKTSANQPLPRAREALPGSEGGAPAR